MVDLTKPSFLTPTITVKGDVVVGKTLRIGQAETTGGNGIEMTYSVVGQPQVTTGGYNGKTYKVIDTVNLFDFAKAVNADLSKESTFILEVPDNIAIVGTDVLAHALIIDDRWPNKVKVTVNNRGLILGRGGGGAGRDDPIDGLPGGNGVNNTSTARAKLINHGVVAGGGGGAGRNDKGQTKYLGGGGAPYGAGGAGGMSAFGPKSAPASNFTTPGGGRDGIGKFGGGWGLPGGNGSTSGGLAGYFATGNVVVVNIDGGVTLGTDGMAPVEDPVIVPDTGDTSTLLDFSNLSSTILANDPWWVDSKNGGVYNGKTYSIFREIDLLVLFQGRYGRLPNANEVVKVLIPETAALVGGVITPNGLLIPAAWPSSASITIENRGLILGQGGTAWKFGSDALQVENARGKTAIKNASSSAVTVKNYGGIAGGGGAGGTAMDRYYLGGAGAPWGLWTYQDIGNGQDSYGASFIAGGGAAGYGSNRGGTGGGWGLPGAAGYGGTSNSTDGGAAGFISEGNVTINNINDGWSKGLEGSSGTITVIDLTTAIPGLISNDPKYQGSKDGGVYNGKTYLIYRGVNLLTIFKSKFSRDPEANEIVKLIVPDNVALVGLSGSKSGLLVPADWPASANVLVENRGLILGIGGHGVGKDPSPLQLGGDGVGNLSTAKVKVTNYSVVAAGGGGGWYDGGWMNIPGGGGAPFGEKGTGANGILASAGFTNPGTHNTGVPGGEWGFSTSDGRGLTGFISVGDTTVVNVNNGWARGREGYFTGTPEVPEEPEIPTEPETPVIDAKGHLIAYGGKLGTNGYMSSTGAAIQGAHGEGGLFNVLESIDNVIITKKSAAAGRVGGSPNYWDAQPGGVGYNDYFNEVVGGGGTGAAPAKAGTATAGGAGGGAAHVRGTIKNMTNQAITIIAYCGKAYRQSPMSEQQMGVHGSLQLLLSTVGGGTGGGVDFIYPNENRTPTDIVILNNESAEIWLVGAGAGAGGASKAGLLGTNGANGSTSVLTIGNINQIAGGGFGGSFSTAATKQEGTGVVWVNSDGISGNGGVCTVNRNITLPDGIQINFEVIEDGFRSSGKNNQGVSRGGAGKIIGTWGTFGAGGTAATLVGDTQPLASPGAGGAGSYIKVVISNASGENFTVKAIAGAKGIDGINRFGERNNSALDGIVIVRKGGIQSNTSETIVSLPESTQSFVSLAINEEMDFEMIGGGGAGGSVSYYVGASQTDLKNLGGNGQIASMKLADELKWDGSQYVQPETVLFAMNGGYGGGPSFGTKPGVNGEAPAAFTDPLTLPAGINITGQYTRGQTVTRTSDNVQQLGPIGYTAMDDVVYGSGGNGGDGNPASPGAGASGNIYKGTIKNTSNKVFNFRLNTNTGGVVNADATLGDGRGQNGGAPGLVYKRRYNSGVDETHLIYPEDAQKDIFIPNNAQAEIWIIGGGGAFGGSTPYPNPITGVSVLDNGEAGFNSQVVIGQNTFVAGGGKGGVGAVGGTVSQAVGVAGVPTIPVITPITGMVIRVDQQVNGPAVPATIEKIDNPGGHLISGIGQYGYGGASRWGTKSIQVGNFESDVYRGGSGGSGALVKLVVNNTSGVPQVVKAIAGKAGSRSVREFYDIAEMAGSGLVVIKIKKL